MMVYGEGYLIDEQSRVTRRFPYTEAFNLGKLVYLWDNILQQTTGMKSVTIGAGCPTE
jgi:hypothetical protein